MPYLKDKRDSELFRAEKDPVLGFLIMVSKDDVKLDQQKIQFGCFLDGSTPTYRFGIGAFNQICRKVIYDIR